MNHRCHLRADWRVRTEECSRSSRSSGTQMWRGGVQTSGLKQSVRESGVSSGLSPSFPLCFSFLSTSPEEVGLVPHCLLFKINVCSCVCLWHLKEATYCTRTQWLKASRLHSFMRSPTSLILPPRWTEAVTPPCDHHYQPKNLTNMNSVFFNWFIYLKETMHITVFISLFIFNL